MYIVSTLAPVFCLVAVGLVLRRSAFLDESFFEGCAKITYWVGLPSLLLVQIAESDFNPRASWRIFAAILGATLAMAALGACLARLLKLAPERSKTFIQTSFHCNTAFVGLPVLMVALSQAGTQHGLMDIASMALAPTIPAVNILSILVLRGRELLHPRKFFVIFFQKILMNPLVLACFGGMALSFLDIALPLTLRRSFDALGKMALPLALLSIGAGLRWRHMTDGLGSAVLASILNIAVLPLLGYALCLIWGFPPEHILIVLIILSCPTASSSYIYARQIAGDTVFAASVIMISTVLSGISLAATLHFYGITG